MSSFSDGLASFASSTFTPDQLFVSADDLVTRKITVLSGQVVVRGAILGKITIGAVTSAAKSGGNTGNGTCVPDVTTPLLVNAQTGVYTLRCTVAGTNSATFRLVNPKGDVLGDFALSGSGASVTVADQIKLAITDGSTDFIVGDGFDITVAAGSGKYSLSLSAAVDGSQVPDCIAALAVDASAGDKEELGYFRGQFNSNAVTLGTGHTVASVREGLRLKGVDLIDVIPA